MHYDPELESVGFYAPVNAQSTFNSDIVTDEAVVLCICCSIVFWNGVHNFSAVRSKLVQPKATFLTQGLGVLDQLFGLFHGWY